MDPSTTIFAQWAHYFLVWVGFGTLVGLLAKAIMPGKDPGGALATVLIGVFGSIIGAGVLVYFSDSMRVSPISVPGFVVAILGTGLLLIIYRILSGKGFREGFARWRGKRGRRSITVVEK